MKERVAILFREILISLNPPKWGKTKVRLITCLEEEMCETNASVL